MERSTSRGISARYMMAALLKYSWLFVFSLGMPADAAQKLSEHDVINYLAQSVCLDELRRPTAGTPLDANCRSKRPQAAADRVFYRKHDWPNADDIRRATTGYQASDSVIKERGGRAWIIQTFDFGDAPRTFGKFDAGQGDGGQLLAMMDGWASAIMTEDGGAGVQWFIGPGCRQKMVQDGGGAVADVPEHAGMPSENTKSHTYLSGPFQHVHYAADDAAIVRALDPPYSRRQPRLDPIPLLIAQPK
jgi:hypothetical protein